MIGAPASALRAGLMVSLFFLARGLGRAAAGKRSLVFAAVILLWENPLILKLDVGFQLSFLAMAGLIYWPSFFKEKIFKKLPELLKVNLATTLAAQVFTLPLLIYNFGYVSLISPLTNLLLVPLIPYLTMAGFIFGILGIVSFSLGQVLAWFVWLGAGYILLVVDWSLKIPGSHFVFRGVAGPSVVISYLFLIYLTWRTRENPGPKFL
jgi:competence protein ComEC